MGGVRMGRASYSMTMLRADQLAPTIVLGADERAEFRRALAHRLEADLLELRRGRGDEIVNCGATRFECGVLTQ
jgi:hypothetical protein